MFRTGYAPGGLNYRSAGELNSAMGKVYANMGLAVLTSMIISMLVAGSPALMAFLFTGVMKWIVIFAPLAAVFAVSIALNANPPAPVAHMLLHGFATLMGLSFASIFVVYNLGSIVSAFMGAAVLFGVMSGYGYFTKKSLDSIGKWLIVGLIAIIIASIINIFVGSTVFQMVLSALAIVVFLGLTAWDTQRIREELAINTSTAAEVSGALSLYLNFINIFLNLLQLFGNRND
jgi:FtsH-binding integral membrane protein